MKRDTEYGLRETGDWDRRSLGVGVFPSPLRLRASALKPLTTHHSPLTTPARAAFTLMELLVVMSIMLIVSTILVAGYFGMTRAASYTAAETDVFNHLQLARQRASLDGTRVFFLLIDSNSYVLVHGAGTLTKDMDSKTFGGRHRFYDAYADLHEAWRSVRAAVDTDQHGAVFADVGPEHGEVLLVVVAAHDDQDLAAIDLRPDLRDADAVEEEVALPEEVLGRVRREGLQLQ